MNLADIVRNGVATINTVTADLQSDVTHEAYSSQDEYGKATFAAAVTRQAIVEEGTMDHRLANGEVVTTVAHIAFLFPVSVDARDRMTLESGTTGPIVLIPPGVVDPSTGATYMKDIWLGKGGARD